MNTSRSRAPSGRVNTTALDSLPPSNPVSGRLSQRSDGSNSNLFSARSEMSTNEVLRRIKDKIEEPKRLKATAEIEAMGEYNAFSRPRPSQAQPLRSVFLDPEINNFPPSRTRSELLKRIKISGTPHPSYDLDHDGYVSQEDYRLAKKFDLDGNGVLDPNERRIAQMVLSEEFFRRNAKNLHVFGPSISKNTHKQNVDNLVNSYSFERSYERLMSIERTMIAESSKPVFSCMEFTGGDHILKHNYYTNKFDTTAWNDLEAIPRSSSSLPIEEHGGSRKRLLFTRKEIVKLENQAKSDQLAASMPFVNTKRVNLITNTAIENS